MKITDIFSKVFWAFLGALTLFLSYRGMSWEIAARKYEKAFLQIQHPANTSYIDSLSFNYSYYPATFVDDSIQFKSANLVGEIRSYAGDLEEIKSLYRAQTLEGLAGPITVLPVEVYQGKRKISLNIPDGYSFSPGDYDILEGVEEYKKLLETLKNRQSAGQRLYLVYCLWH